MKKTHKIILGITLVTITLTLTLYLLVQVFFNMDLDISKNRMNISFFPITHIHNYDIHYETNLEKQSYQGKLT